MWMYKTDKGDTKRTMTQIASDRLSVRWFLREKTIKGEKYMIDEGRAGTQFGHQNPEGEWEHELEGGAIVAY